LVVSGQRLRAVAHSGEWRLGTTTALSGATTANVSLFNTREENLDPDKM
jgi:hypothetical protein